MEWSPTAAPGPAVVLVTGASSGIGRATAQEVAGRGAHVVLVARGERSLRDTAAACLADGAASTLVLTADVGDDAAVREAVGAAVGRYGRLDAVVHAAGVVAYGRTETVPAEVYDGVLRTNLHGSANVVRHVLPVLRAQGVGSLLLVGSVIGHANVPSLSAYGVSKWGVRALARQVRLENRDRPGVRVLYVAPGGVDTPIYDQAAAYDGFIGRPPPPVASARRTARQIVRRLERGHGRAQLTFTNDLIRLGFTALPGLYDRLVGPLAAFTAVDLTRPVGPRPGNVLTSGDRHNAEDGGHGSAVLGILRNLRATLKRRRAG